MKPNQIIELDYVFQAINAGIIVINDQDLVCYCNPVAAHLIGLGMLTNFLDSISRPNGGTVTRLGRKALSLLEPRIRGV